MDTGQYKGLLVLNGLISDPKEVYFRRYQTPDRGRGLVASQDLKPGLVVLTEEAAAVGPASPFACVECLSVTHSTFNTKEDEVTFRCPKCGHRLCQKCLQLTPEHRIRHDVTECHMLCKLLMLNEVGLGLYNLIFPLRLVLLKDKAPLLYNKLMTLEDHLEKRIAQGGPTTSSLCIMASLLTGMTGISECEARKAIGIEFTNGFEINLPGICGRGIYPIISLVNHSCVPNIAHSHIVKSADIGFPGTTSCISACGIVRPVSDVSTPQFHLELKVQRSIAAGTELTIRYNSAFDGYVSRQRTFAHDWFFRCECARCSDPTEFGTFTSAVKCFQCSKGFVIPHPTNQQNGEEEVDELSSTLNDVEAMEEDDRFRCNSCGSVCKHNFAELVEQDVLNHMGQDNPPLQQLVELLKACVATLHNKHYLVMLLKDSFVATRTHDVALLKLQERYAKELLEYLETLNPGQTWRKAQLLIRLRSIMTALAKKRSESSDNDIEALRKALRSIQDLSISLDKFQ